ncbi:hypothetical protein QLX52_14275 [Streptomyces albus]|uniref:hypothetical protein n=1 Tax=Streptomyces albus TaxID=1888 RepID=UPI0024AE2D3C|nr:hypothetical protein [Streptomyces albus]MDI6409997.1 hypothetical protein [Streptomyces albus]
MSRLLRPQRRGSDGDGAGPRPHAGRRHAAAGLPGAAATTAGATTVTTSAVSLNETPSSVY